MGESSTVLLEPFACWNLRFAERLEPGLVLLADDSEID